MWAQSEQGINSEYPEYLRDKYALLSSCPRLKLPPSLPTDYIPEPSTDLTLCNVRQHVYLLINDYPEFFINVVDEWIQYVKRDEEEKRLEDARYGIVYLPTSRFKPRMNDLIKFERMLKQAFQEAMAAYQDLSPPEQRSCLYTEAGQRKAERECAIRHEEVAEEDLDHDCPERCLSPSPAFRPPTPESKPTSPSKRTSDTHGHAEGSKRYRTGTLPTPAPSPSRYRSSSPRILGSAFSTPRRSAANPLPTFSSFTFKQSPVPDPHSPSSTARPSLVISSTSSRSNHLVTPSTPTDLYQSDFEFNAPEAEPLPEFEPVPLSDSEQDDKAWRPVSARPEHERTVLVLPTNHNQSLFWKYDVKFHVQWELERRMAQQTEVGWDDLHVSDFRILRGDVIDALPRVELLLEAAGLRAAKRMEDLDDSVFPRISSLSVQSPNSAAAPRTTDIESMISERLLSQPSMGSDSSRRMSTEADREEASIRAQDGKGSFSDDPEWKYGGKLVYTIYVRPIENSMKSRLLDPGVSGVQLHCPRSETPPASSPDSPRNQVNSKARLPFTMELRPPTMPGKSFHLARKFGSRRILHFKFADIHDPKARREMFDLFHGRRFVLAGRVYRAWWAPTDKSSVVAIEVSDTIPGLTIPHTMRRLVPAMPSYIELLRSSNDLEMKCSQAMAKWASRPQLLLSDTYPAVRLSPSDIGIIDDIIVAGLAGPATTEQTLTDGCGLMTEAVARHIGIRLSPALGRPCVVQMRIMGAKGLLVLMTPEQEELYPGKSVLLRKSMVKSMTTSLDQSRHILEIVRCGNNVLKTSACLPAEVIIAMNARHVPHQVLINKAEVALDDLRDHFNPEPSGTETMNDVRQRLSTMLYTTGGVGVERKKRDCADKALSPRVAGLIHDDKDKLDLGNEVTCDTRNESGQPAQVAESAMMAIDAGFDPRQSAYTCQLLHRHVQNQVENQTKQFRIPVNQSMSAYIIPDTQNVLGPKEIYVAFLGEGPIDPITGCPLSHLLGPVLAFRSPCKLPTDVQKYTAVYRPELRHLTDCIVMSASATECRQSPASFLAGGDYDGDVATVIFDPAFVQPFVQAEDSIANTPDGFEEQNFEKELVKGDHFLEQLSGSGEETMARNYQTFLLGAVMDDKVTGQYSIMHDVAVYKYGHDHPETIRLARMFSMVLDARKSGLCVRPKILSGDRYKYSGFLKWQAHKKDENDDRGKMPVKRGKGLQPFIMDRLILANESKGEEIMATFPQETATHDRSDYQHLSELYSAKVKQVNNYGSDCVRLQLAEVERHVSACYAIWEQIRIDMIPKDHSVDDLYRLKMSGEEVPLGRRENRNQSPTKGRTARPQNLATQAYKRDLAATWHRALPVEKVSGLCADINELKRLMISCSAAQSKYRPKQLFPFDVDFVTTLALKAEKVGRAMTITSDAMMAKKPTWRPAKG